MARGAQPDRAMIVAARHVENLAYRIPAATEVLARLFADLDGHKAHTPGDGVVRGGGGGEPGSIVDRHAEQRLGILDDLEQLDEDVRTITAVALSAQRICDRLCGATGRRVCSADGHAGADATWTPGRTLAEGNGWANLECHETATANGLCPSCDRRSRRWQDHQRTALASVEA